MRLRNTILMTGFLFAAGGVNAAKQCMPCPAGQWGVGGKCEQDCAAGFYCQAGARVACTGMQYCPPGSGNPQDCPTGHTCRNGLPLFDAISAPVGSCTEGTFPFASNYRVVINGGKGGYSGSHAGGSGAGITMDIMVKKAGMAYKLCAGGNGGNGGQSCGEWYSDICGKGEDQDICQKQRCKSTSGTGGASSINYGSGYSGTEGRNINGLNGAGSGGGGAASALYIGGELIAIAGGGGGAYGGTSGANKVPSKGGSTADYEIMEASVGTSAGGSASMSGISAD
ncbi:MAG: hypothetical protein LBI17_03260 [Rickettsiales bacterium]|nr:hypothetical protein [Rickettsiales bacterium]